MARKSRHSIYCDQCHKEYETINAAAVLPHGWVLAGELTVGDLTIKTRYIREFCSSDCYVQWLRNELLKMESAVECYIRDYKRHPMVLSDK